MGLNLEKLSELQKRVRDQMSRRGFPQYAEDASQDYALKRVQNKRAHQTVDQFCIEYIRKHHYGSKRKDGVHRYVYVTDKQLDSLLFTNADAIENEIDNRKLIKMIMQMRNPKHRRIMLLYYFSDLTGAEIAAREGIHFMTVHQAIWRAIRRMREEIFSKPIEAV